MWRKNNFPTVLYLLQDRFQILFHHWFNLFNSSFRSAQQFLWHFSSSFPAFEHWRSVSLKSWPVLSRFFMNYFLCDPPKAIISEDFFVLSFQLRPPTILNWCLFVRLHIRTVVHSRLLFHCYRINSFVIFIILPVSHWRLFSSLAISLSNPFQEE